MNVLEKTECVSLVVDVRDVRINKSLMRFEKLLEKKFCTKILWLSSQNIKVLKIETKKYIQEDVIVLRLGALKTTVSVIKRVLVVPDFADVLIARMIK